MHCITLLRCGKASDNYQTESCLGVTVSQHFIHIILFIETVCSGLTPCVDWQIPDDHLSGCVVYPHPEQPDRKVIKPDGTGLPDTDVLLYVKAESTDKCRADVSSGSVLYWTKAKIIFLCVMIKVYFTSIKVKLWF